MKMMKKTSLVLLASSLLLVLVACGGFVYTTVGGTVTGLGNSTTSGGTLVLRNEGNFVQQLTVDGPFSFKVASNASYTISVATQPAQVNCAVANGTGTMTSDAAVTNIAVTCVPKVPVIATVSGLTAGSLLLYNNANVNLDALTFTTNIAGTFSYYIPNGSAYAVTIGLQPAAQTCTVQNGSGTASTTNPQLAANVLVNCVPSVPVSVIITGLGSGKSVVLANGADSLTEGANGTFTFANSVLDGQPYAVTVTTQPVGQTCTVVGGSGTARLSNPTGASNIQVNCI
ncbi:MULTISPECIES: hypothetical protein [unclassified Undibacterium]|uniref:hypothetical protein n=2 Tax=Undibacterium TaxID=401469 RepID=UPI002B222830|nr:MULTISPECIES: hypothetical protein [unclassified Undibacterium]MEB0230939.1 hypothetical protein [Undibacterium sp. 10I3]MEB0258222.1 hypothetical protein [Undibacterium sp. 5I1]